MHLGDNKYYNESWLRQRVSAYSTENAFQKTFSSLLRESADHYDVFLSHSAKDKNIIRGMLKIIEDMGFSAYVDWIDDSGTGRTDIAPKIKTAIGKSSKLLYIHTHNSINSKWTPWEIGCFDLAKSSTKIAVMPLLNEQNQRPTYAGQEYLEQYNTISPSYLDSFLRRH